MAINGKKAVTFRTQPPKKSKYKNRYKPNGKK